MDDDTASRFVSSLVKSIQALCNGYIDFSSSIEVVGHIHLNIDRNVKLDYVLTEEVSKSLSEGSTVFASHSYHSKPLSNLSKSSGDHSNRNKKSQQNNDTDPLGIGSLPPEVPNATRSESHSRTANRVCDSGDSSLSGSQDFDSVKQENRSSCQVRDSFEKRRRSGPGRRSPSPVAKRGRSNDTNSGVDVIEIKEEPDDEPSVFFGNSAGGADIQTPDFSNVVMESLDRVGQAEGASLVAGDVMQMNKQQPFPVMLHSNMPSTSSSVTGQSDPRASTSGETAKSIPTAPPKSVPTAPPKSIPTAPQHFLTLSGALSQRLTQASSATKIPIRTGIRPVSPCFTEKDLPPNTKPEDIARLTEKHVLERLPPTERKKYPSKRCKVCLSRTNSGRLQGRKYPKESSFHCPKCPSKPGLCMFPCYYIYHTKLNFWEVADAELEGAGGTPWPAGTVGMMQELGTGQSAKQRAEMEVAYFQEGSYSQEARNSFGSREGSVDHSFLTSPQLPGHGEPSSSMYGFSERAEGGQVVIKLEDDKKEDFGHLPLYGESVYGPTLP